MKYTSFLDIQEWHSFEWMKPYISKIAFLGLESSLFVFVNCIFYHSTLGQMHYWWIHHSFCNHVFYSCLPIWLLNNLSLNMQQHLGFYFKHRIPLWGTPLKLNFWTLIAKQKEDFQYIFYSYFSNTKDMYIPNLYYG